MELDREIKYQDCLRRLAEYDAVSDEIADLIIAARSVAWHIPKIKRALNKLDEAYARLLEAQK